MKNVCIVGYGNIGPTHAKALESVKNAHLYAVCDINPAAVLRCREKYNDVIGYQDYDTMLQDTRIDVIHVCTPHYLHFEMIRKALEAGKEVVSEKPITMTAEEFEQLLKSESSEKVCAVIQNRYNTCVQKMKQLIEDGELGEILAVKGIVTWNRDAAYYASGQWRGKWATEGGSALINQALHTLDLMIYLAGNVKDVQASMHNYTLKGVIETEDTVESYMRFENGAVGLFYATNTYPVNSDPEVEVVGTKGIARYAYKKLMLNGELAAEDSAITNGKAYWGSGHEALLRDYYDNGHHFGPADVKNTMQTLFGIYKSAYHGNEKAEILQN